MRIGRCPSVSYPALSRRVTAIRHSADRCWLRDLPLGPADLPVKVMQAVAKDLSLAYAAWFRRMKAGEPGGKPRFKPWDDTVPSFGLNAPESFTVDGNAIRLPKLGWLRLSGHDRYADHKARGVRIRMEGTKAQPRWYAYIVYEVPAEAVQQGAESGAVGLDRNVGQATDSDGRIYRAADTSDLDPKIKRYQRRMARQKKGSNRRRRTGWKLRKLQRKRSRRRESTAHAHTRRITDTAHTVAVEDLNTKAMTRAGKGKRGLNREILASGWGALDRQLAYKAGAVVKVGPGVHVADLLAVRPRRPGQPTDATLFPMHGLWLVRPRGSERGRQHFGPRGTSAPDPSGPRMRGFCTARSVAPLWLRPYAQSNDP